jgi:hypothetical protein
MTKVLVAGEWPVELVQAQAALKRARASLSAQKAKEASRPADVGTVTSRPC